MPRGVYPDVSQGIGYSKGKSAIHVARMYGEQRRNFVGQHSWARGYFVSTVGRDEAVIRSYIRSQEHEDPAYRPTSAPRFPDVRCGDRSLLGLFRSRNLFG